MPSVNQINTKLDTTVRVFDTFNDFGIEVPADEYDVVYSYISSVFKDQTAALNFTTSIFRIAAETNTPVLTVLQQIQDGDKIRVTANIAYYLNGLRSPSTLLGINTAVTPTVWAARNILP